MAKICVWKRDLVKLKVPHRNYAINPKGVLKIYSKFLKSSVLHAILYITWNEPFDRFHGVKRIIFNCKCILQPPQKLWCHLLSSSMRLDGVVSYINCLTITCCWVTHLVSSWCSLSKNFFSNLFLFGCAGSPPLRGLYAGCGVRASHCSSFSCCRAWALGHVGFSSCSSWA